MDVQLATFVVGVALLLVTPGPTNTLLALSGVSVGFWRSVPLVFAEALGYTISIATLYFIVRPLAAAAPLVELSLRAACGLYVAHAALTLWRKGASSTRHSNTVTFQKLMLTTLLNPKGSVIAFIFMPAAMTPHHYFPVLLGLTSIAGCAWIAAATALGGVAPMSTGIACRAGAIVLFAFSTLMLASAAGNPHLLNLAS